MAIRASQLTFFISLGGGQLHSLVNKKNGQLGEKPIQDHQNPCIDSN